MRGFGREGADCLEVLRAGAQAMGMELSPLQMDQFRRYRAGLSEWNRRVNITSRSALAQVERAHFLDSLSLVPLLRREASGDGRLIDVGSGGGFPGLPVKVVLPELQVTLVEATGKKARFLRWLVGELGMAGVEVLEERAEILAHGGTYRERFNVATARALGGLPVMLELTLPFCCQGGIVVAPRRGDIEAEVAGAAYALRTLGGRLRCVEAVEAPGVVGGSVLVVVEKVGPTPEQYPRRPGMPAKRPL